MKTWLATLALLLISFGSTAAGPGDLSNKDAVVGLKDALTQGAATAVGQLGVENGFLGNKAVRIPLPDTLRRVEGGLRLMGMKDQADELVKAMNHAAEQAVVEAKPLLVSAIQKLSVNDAIGILRGSDTAATEYFRRTTSAELTQKFLPIVTQATSRVGLAEKYNQIAGKASSLGVMDAKEAKIENYVTQKALDGLFHMIAEQEKAIRTNPIQASTGMAQKVFGLFAK
jgi:hypothetical protein